MGLNTIVWALTGCHVPGVIGDTGGRLDPSARATGFENVSVIGVPGRIEEPGAGEATAAVAAPAGNQLTSAAGETSHVRGAAATSIVPAGAARSSVTSLSGAPSRWRRSWPGGPYATTLTGEKKLSLSGAPGASVR